MTLNGQETAPRGTKCYERRGQTLVLHDVTHNVITHQARKLNYHFMVAEWLWMLNGLSDVKTIAGYNNNIAKFSDDGEVFFGAYGPRIRRDLLSIETLLKRDHDTRQAVMCTWRPEALWQPTKDVPCTLTWQFFIRQEKLELHVNMRSNDVWLGLPYDLYNFTQIQRYLAARLDVGLGSYYHHVGSLHVYENNLDAANAAVKTPWATRVLGPSPAPFWHDDTYLLNILEGLPRGFSVENARKLRELVMKPWQPFAEVLIHRFSKEPADLSTREPYFHNLIHATV